MLYTVSVKPKVEDISKRFGRRACINACAMPSAAWRTSRVHPVVAKGADDLYRIRVGDHRIIYQIQDAVLVVLVVQLGNRREIYRT